MGTNTAHRTFIEDISASSPGEVLLRGWVYRLRVLGKTSFIVLRDCSGTAQCVAATETLQNHRLKVEDVVEIRGIVREDSRSKAGFEIHVRDVQVLNRAGNTLPFQSADDVEAIGLDTLLQFRPLALRTEAVGDVFRIQAALLGCFRDALNRRRFTEIVTSKIVSGGTEGGSNLFEIQYFDRVAYLAQSPQFYKEHGVAGLERVYETGHVYRAEPHASSRHLTEYLSLDVEFGFIDGPEDVIQLERELLTDIFENLNSRYGNILRKYRREPLPSMLGDSMLGIRLMPGNAAQQVRADRPGGRSGPRRRTPTLRTCKTRERIPCRVRSWISACGAPVLHRPAGDAGRREQFRFVVPRD